MLVRGFSSPLRFAHLPSLTGEKGDDDGRGCDDGSEGDGLGEDTDGPGSSVGEAGRDATLGLRIDPQEERVEKRGRSSSEAPHPQPADLHRMGPAAVNQLVRRATEKRDALRQSFGDEAWLSAIALPPTAPEECG